MKGSVRKHGKLWYYRLELARINGKRQQIERYGGKSKDEALKKMREAIKQYESAGEVFEVATISVHDYFEYWYKNYVLVNLKLNTQKNYRGMLDNHIYPAIGSYRLSVIKPATLQDLLNEKFNAGLAKQTLDILKGVLRKGFGMAVYPYQYLTIDPTQHIAVPHYDQKDGKDRDGLKIITMEDFNTLCSIVKPNDPYYLPMMISFQTGLRRAEVSGLRWKDIDFEEETLTVEQIMIQDGKNYMIGTPKIKSSFRTILMGQTLIKILKRARIQQKENQLLYGERYIQTEFVCVKENGKPVTPNSIKWYTQKYRNKTGVNFNFHSFRHTHATMLLENGSKPKEIQQRLGHSRISTTMDTYAHVTKKMKRDTVDIFEKMLSDTSLSNL
ncbi:tyrosine-type recombinase/integrase [Enterococcus sp. CSURQ0835]|uniref:tyrosine-type recombinase/integrase n=1 Tax=Enterococcus sp. CSURQ0835 TaxID=2681394 RepID=UPI00135C443C|nr:site-specific integrase [Enterococcus sp. CSURQ0835]